MRIFVCVKQVPDTTGKVAVNENGTLDRGSMPTITNPDDKNALEAALQLKETLGCQVTVITMGPPPAEGMLRELMAMGADDAVLVSGREFGGSDTFATSQILAAALRSSGFSHDDLVFCGQQAIDGDTAQVGPQIAEKLDLVQATYVTAVAQEGDALLVRRKTDTGYAVLRIAPPCLLTFIREANHPRLMNVGDIMQCYRKPLSLLDYNALKADPLIALDTIGLHGSPTNVFRSFTPPQKAGGIRLSGTEKEMAEQLAGLLKKTV